MHHQCTVPAGYVDEYEYRGGCFGGQGCRGWDGFGGRRRDGRGCGLGGCVGGGDHPWSGYVISCRIVRCSITMRGSLKLVHGSPNEKKNMKERKKEDKKPHIAVKENRNEMTHVCLRE